MTNDLKNFLEEQVRKFCSEADDSMFPVELDRSYTEVVNFVLSLVEKELGKEAEEGTLVSIKDISTIINNLRV